MPALRAARGRPFACAGERYAGTRLVIYTPVILVWFTFIAFVVPIVFIFFIFVFYLPADLTAR